MMNSKETRERPAACDNTSDVLLDGAQSAPACGAAGCTGGNDSGCSSPAMNTVWALDFMRDALYEGRVFRTLNVIDQANRGALGIDIATSISAVRVADFVTQLIDLHGMPPRH
jgi:transposase InsO family protein